MKQTYGKVKQVCGANSIDGCVWECVMMSGDIPSCMYPFIYPIYCSYFTSFYFAYIHLLLFGYHLNLSCSQ